MVAIRFSARRFGRALPAPVHLCTTRKPYSSDPMFRTSDRALSIMSCGRWLTEKVQDHGSPLDGHAALRARALWKWSGAHDVVVFAKENATMAAGLGCSATG
jgi:hypothetical protein